MAEIRHRLDLVLFLIDTTTGLGIYTPPIRIYKNGEKILFQRRSTGQVLVVGCGRENFDLSVELSGFEHTTVRVEYEKINEQMPLLQLHMIPLASEETLSFAGKLEGITALDAIPATGDCCLLGPVNHKKKQVTMVSQYPLSLENFYYAVRNDADETYQVFSILKEIQPKVYEVDCIPQVEPKSMPIVPVNIGQVKPDGSYLLRVRDESRQVDWILRWQIGGEIFFKKINFHDTSNITL